MSEFAIKHQNKPLFIHSDIDSSGMLILLAPKTGRQDTWTNVDEAAAFMRRCTERYPGTPLEVVPC